MTREPNRVRMSVSLAPEIARQLDEQQAHKNLNRSEAVEQALKEWIERGIEEDQERLTGFNYWMYQRQKELEEQMGSSHDLRRIVRLGSRNASTGPNRQSHPKSFSTCGSGPRRPNFATNPATHREIWFGGILLVVRFSLARCLPGSHARFRIFIRHHNMLCWPRGVPEADSAPSRALGHRSMQDTVCRLPKRPLPRTRVHKAPGLLYGRHRRRGTRVRSRVWLPVTVSAAA